MNDKFLIVCPNNHIDTATPGTAQYDECKRRDSAGFLDALPIPSRDCCMCRLERERDEKLMEWDN
jgi:hypothetical protein